MTSQVLDLSHALRPGMRTHPGLPEPEWEPFTTRREYEQASGTTFQIDRVCMVGNTGTCSDSPYHRYADGADLAGIPLSQVVDVPIVVVDARERRAVDSSWGQESCAVDAPYVTADAAEWLALRRPALVGIDSVDIDDLPDARRPVHSRLLADDVLILEHLSGLGGVPARGARLHAAPLAWHGVGTWPVPAYGTFVR